MHTSLQKLPWTILVEPISATKNRWIYRSRKLSRRKLLIWQYSNFVKISYKKPRPVFSLKSGWKTYLNYTKISHKFKSNTVFRKNDFIYERNFYVVFGLLYFCNRFKMSQNSSQNTILAGIANIFLTLSIWRFLRLYSYKPSLDCTNWFIEKS